MPIDKVPRKPPFELVVSPDARHGVLRSLERGDVLDERGNALPTDQGDPIAFDDRVYINGSASDWQGKRLGEELDRLTAPAEARRIDATRSASLMNSGPSRGDRLTPELFGVVGARRGADSSSSLWNAGSPGRGVGAIGADFTAVLAMNDGKLQVFLPIADERYQAQLAGERNIGVAAKWVSIIGPHIIVIAPDGGGSKLMGFTGDTTPVYSLTVAFEVLQPAIAGGGKRVYLAGKGLAALDDGKVTWLHPSTEPVYASTFEDGSLAVATGKRLDFLKPDGTVDQSFNTEEPLVAPPAIAGDGSVWAASATTLYIAR